MANGAAQGASARGTKFERDVRKILTDDGYMVIRSAASKTACDMVAVKYGEILFVQCKASGNGQITPDERRDLFELAYRLDQQGFSPATSRARAVVAHQDRTIRPYAFQWRQLIGRAADQWIPWMPDRVLADG